MNIAPTIMMMNSTVFLVEDDPAMRLSTRTLLESVRLKVESFATGGDFLDRYTGDEAGCLLLDLRLPDMSGLQLLSQLRQDGKVCPPVVMITGHGDVSSAVQAMKMGVLDFIQKPFSAQQLLEQVQAALERDRRERKNRIGQYRISEAMDSLSDRERQVLDLLLQGQSNKQIATALGLSSKTVSTHRINLMEKLGASSLVELAHACLQTA